METIHTPCLGCGTRSYTYVFAVYEEGVVCSRMCSDVYEKERLKQDESAMSAQKTMHPHLEDA